MTHERQHGQSRFYQHARIPLTTSAQTQVGRKPICFGKPVIGKNNHLVINPINEVLKGAPIMYIGCVAIPVHNESKMVVQQTKFSTDNPSLIGNAFASDLSLRASFSTRVNQLIP